MVKRGRVKGTGGGCWNCGKGRMSISGGEGKAKGGGGGEGRR